MARDGIKLGKQPLGKLHSVLDNGFPRHRNKQGGLNIRRLAKEMHMTREGIYLWFRKEAITPKIADRLVSLSNGRIRLEHLAEFIFVNEA